MKHLVALLLSCLPLLGATYYVDQSAGNDNNPGGINQPWKNCPGMYLAGVAMHTGAHTLAAGDTVYLDSGDTWQVSNEVPGSGGGFILTAGVTVIGNVWPTEITSRPWPAQYGAKIQAAGTCTSGLVRVNDDDETYVTKIVGCELDGNSQMVNFFDVNFGYYVTGLINKDKWADNCYMHDGEGDGSLPGGIGFRYGVAIGDNSPDASARVANVKVTSCRVERSARDLFNFYPSNNGMLSNCWATNTLLTGIKNDDSYFEGHGFVFKGLVKDSGIVNCVVSNVNSSAVFFSGNENGTGPGPTNILVLGCILETQDNNGVIRSYEAGPKKFDVVSTIIKNNEQTGTFHMQGDTGAFEINVVNCVFMGYTDIGNPTGSGTLNFRNNIIYEVDDLCFNDAGSDVDTRSNNVYYKVNGGNLVNRGGVNYTSANITSYEANAIVLDPKFLNLSDLPNAFTGTVEAGTLRPDATGLSLQATSPAIDMGAALTYIATIDMRASRPQGLGWDIGVYEYVAESALQTPSRIKVRGVRMSR